MNELMIDWLIESNMLWLYAAWSTTEALEPLVVWTFEDWFVQIPAPGA